MKPTQLIDLFQRARSDSSLAVIEGLQALKHAVRFKAKIEHCITCDLNALRTLLDTLAPDVKDTVLKVVVEVSVETFAKLSTQPIRTQIIALAHRPKYSQTDINPGRPIVFLEDPRDLENIGAVIRVAAAAKAGAVYITGKIDIWHPAVLRGSAGLHFALPVMNVASLEHIRGSRQVVALDPEGNEGITMPGNGIFVFGTERNGISQQLLGSSDVVVRLPMQAGVSSLNLATSVAATLYRLI